MDRQVLFRLHVAAVVLRLAEDVHDAAECALAYRHGNGRTGRAHSEAALQALRRTHRDGAYDAVAELLLDFQREIRVLQLQSFIDLRNGLARKLDVDERRR